MTDTQRALDDFTNATTGLFTATAGSGDISAQDLRDFALTLNLSVGGMYVSSSAETTISVGGTSVKSAGTTTAMAPLNRFTMPASNRLTYTGTPDITALYVATGGLQVASTAALLSLSVADGGTEIASSVQSADAHTAAEPVTITSVGITTLSQNDYLEMFVANEDGTDNVTLATGQLVVVGMFA